MHTYLPVVAALALALTSSPAAAQALDDVLDARRALLQSVMDANARVERQLAILNYVTAVIAAHDAQRPTAFTWTALRRLRDDENAALLDDTLALRPDLAARRTELDGEAPGLLLMASSQPMTAPLATR